MEKLKNLNYFDKLMKLSLVVAALWSLWVAIVYDINDQWVVFLITVLSLFLVTVPEVVCKRYGFFLPNKFFFTITLFIYLAVFLGSAQEFYWKYPWWDTVLHTSSGVLLGFVGLLVFKILKNHKKMDIDPFIAAFFSFCFAVAMGVIWEIYEFAIDTFFGLEMQWGMVAEWVGDERRGVWLLDTMFDLIADTVGALFISIIGYYSLKNEKSEISLLAKKIIEKNFKRRLKKKNKIGK